MRRISAELSNRRNVDSDDGRGAAQQPIEGSSGEDKCGGVPYAAVPGATIPQRGADDALRWHGNGSSDEGAMMTYVNKQEFHAWAYDDLLTNTTRGLLAEYIVATAVGALTAKRVEWDRCDLKVDGVGVEVKSAAYVQAWAQAEPSVISFDIAPKTGWDAATNTHAAGPGRSAAVYVFCLFNGIDPLDVKQWTFYVLPTSVLNRQVPTQKTIRLEPLKALDPQTCTYDELDAAIRAAAAVASGTET